MIEVRLLSPYMTPPVCFVLQMMCKRETNRKHSYKARAAAWDCREANRRIETHTDR